MCKRFDEPMLLPLIAVSTVVSLIAATTGILIIGECTVAAASHPLVRASVCGLMIG